MPDLWDVLGLPQLQFCNIWTILSFDHAQNKRNSLDSQQSGVTYRKWLAHTDSLESDYWDKKMCLKINPCDWMQAWAQYLLPGRAQWRPFVPKNIFAETKSKCFIFLLCFKSTTTGLCLLTWTETGMKQKHQLSCTHSLCEIFFSGEKNWRRLEKKDMSKKLRPGDIFSLKFSQTRRPRGQRLFCCLKSVKWMLVQITG